MFDCRILKVSFHVSSVMKLLGMFNVTSISLICEIDLLKAINLFFVLWG